MLGDIKMAELEGTLVASMDHAPEGRRYEDLSGGKESAGLRREQREGMLALQVRRAKNCCYTTTPSNSLGGERQQGTAAGAH